MFIFFQVFHICDNGRKVSFLCPNGTIFRQSHLICDWWFRVDCERSIELYEESAEQLATDQRIFKERSEALAKAMLKVQPTTKQATDRVVTERSFGPSTTIFNSESQLPNRARYFSDFSSNENQVPAETGSFTGNRFPSNTNTFYTQSNSPVGNWDQTKTDFQSNNNNYQTQSPTTVEPTWNHVVNNNNNYQGGSNVQQAQSLTTTQPIWNQDAVTNNNNNNNNYQSGSNQGQSLTTAQPTWNQPAVDNNNNYQSGNYRVQSTTTEARPTWNQFVVDNNNNYYQSGSYQAQTTTTAAQPTWNEVSVDKNYYQSGSYQSTTTAQPVTSVQNVNSFNSDYQSQYVPSVQNQFVTGSQTAYQSQPTTVVSQTYLNDQSITNNYQTPPTTADGQNPWNNQGADNTFQTEVTSPTTIPTAPDASSSSQNANNNYDNYNSTTNFPQPAKTATAQINNWGQAVSELQQSTNYQSQSETTVQSDWNLQETADDTVNANKHPQQQSRQPYGRPTVSASANDEQTTTARESQVLAESASFVGHNNAPLYSFNLPNNYYHTLAAQTNPPATTYPTTVSYPNDHSSPSNAFSYAEYQKTQEISTARDAVTTTQAPPITMTTVFDYNGGGNNNSTYPPSGETLIPNMINSLQSLQADNNNNALYEFDTSQTNPDDELNFISLYFNNLGGPQDQFTTVASDLQFNNNFEQTSRAYTNGISPFAVTGSLKTTTPATAVSQGLHIPAVLTHNTKQAYNQLFTNDTKKESTTATTTTTTTTGQPPADISKSTPAPGNTANLGLALNINQSSAELRELAAVFTRALTAYLDDPENFRKILAEVRPTEPPATSVNSNVVDEQEVLDYSDDSKGYRSTRKPTTPSSTTETDGGIPQNINALVDLSTTIPQYTTSPLIEITSKFTEVPNTAGVREYAPLADSEQLQTAGSHSFYSRKDNSIETPSKTVKPVSTSTLTWTVSPIIDTDRKTKATTQQLPVHFTTTTTENIETTAIMQKAKEMFSHLNESDANILMNVMRTAHANDTVKR